MKSEQTGEYGEVSRMGIVYSKVDANTMKLELYGLDEYGSLDDDPGTTLEYKRFIDFFSWFWAEGVFQHT